MERVPAIVCVLVAIATVKVWGQQCVPENATGCSRTSTLPSQKCCTNIPLYCNLANTCIPCKQVNEVNCLDTLASSQACCPGLVCSSGVCVMANPGQSTTQVVMTPLPTTSTPQQTTINPVCVPEGAVGCRRTSTLASQKCCTNKPLYCNLANVCIPCKQLNEIACMNTSASSLACCPGLVCVGGTCLLPFATQLTPLVTAPPVTTTVSTTLSSAQTSTANVTTPFTTSFAQTSTPSDTTPYTTSSAQTSTANVTTPFTTSSALTSTPSDTTPFTTSSAQTSTPSDTTPFTTSSAQTSSSNDTTPFTTSMP